MKTIYSSSQIVGDFPSQEKEFEVCAIADAQFDEEHSKLIMELDAFVRPVDLVAKEEHLQAGWLPKKETVNETVSVEEAPGLAREVFHRWVRKVRQAMPSLVHC
jgi:hypothetical protein